VGAYTVIAGEHPLQTAPQLARLPLVEIKASAVPRMSSSFTFTNTPGGFFSVVGSTNPALPLSNWTSLGGALEVLPGQFRFSDSQARSIPARRFYLVRSP
jgi:hypothetical protein